MVLPTAMGSLMRNRSIQVVQSRFIRAGSEATRLAPWTVPAIGIAGWIFYPVLMNVYKDYLQEQADAAAVEAAKKEAVEEDD